jgi:hypothetical protein
VVRHAAQKLPAHCTMLATPKIPGRLRELLGSRLDREIYLSTEEAAQYAGRPSREAFIKWARRHGIPLRKPAGARVFVVRKSDIDHALRGDPCQA